MLRTTVFGVTKHTQGQTFGLGSIRLGEPNRNCHPLPSLIQLESSANFLFFFFYTRFTHLFKARLSWTARQVDTDVLKDKVTLKTDKIILTSVIIILTFWRDSRAHLLAIVGSGCSQGGLWKGQKALGDYIMAALLLRQI